MFKPLTKEQALDYLQEKIKDPQANYEQLLKDSSFEKYGFRYMNKVIDKYKTKVGTK